VFCTADGWARALPMKLKSEAHEALSMLFHQDCMPNVMVMDGAKVRVDFGQNSCDDGCHIKHTDVSNSNLGEGGVQELKR
jgi:hypothetical protein